jgi:hypothetical protein
MRNGLTPVQETIQALVETLLNSGVVCKTAADGELLLELYSLLEYLEPDEHDVAARLSQVRFVPARTADLSLYLVYIPLSDVLTHLVPASTLPQAQALCQCLATALLRGDLPSPYSVLVGTPELLTTPK